MGKLSIDGTKVRANASKRKAMSFDRMQAEEQRLESEIEALLRQADAVDEVEDSRLGAEVRGDDLTEKKRRRCKSVWNGDPGSEGTVPEAAARAAYDARCRQPVQVRNPKGGRPYMRAYVERPTCSLRSSTLRTRKVLIDEDEQRGIPAVLQRAGDGGRGCTS